MSTQRFGVCCECQSVHPLKNRPANPCFWEFGFGDPSDAEEFRFVMDAHQPFGEKWCDGEGTYPQALLPEKK